jgi:hypothetical protein
MGALGRGFVALAILATTGCAATQPHLAFTKPAGYVPWAPLAATHNYVEAPPAPVVPPLPIPAGTPACQASQLEGAGVEGGGAGGNVNMPLMFRNMSSTACFLEGYVDVTVLDRAGAVLARGTGKTGRGTFFPEGPVTELLMTTGTPKLRAFGAHRPAGTGQAYMNFSWYDCRELQAAQLAIGLPDGGGTFRMPYPAKAAWYGACDSSRSYKAIQRGALMPSGTQWPPPPEYINVHVAIDAPASAAPGTDLTYYVTIHNLSTKAFDLLPCADYSEMLTPKENIADYRLNCGGVKAIAAGQRVTFEMRMTLPTTTATGSRQICWYLIDGRIDNGNVCAPIRIS